MKPISNVEFMLLHLLATNGALSGYDINKLVKRYGFREWADIGTTSVYVSLNKLDKKNFIEVSLDTAKTGKGPIPKKFQIVPSGRRELKREIKLTISSPIAKSERYKLSLVAIDILTKSEMTAVFKTRKANLIRHLDTLNSKHFLTQGGLSLPNNARWTFQHSMSTYSSEIKFVQMVLDDLRATDEL